MSDQLVSKIITAVSGSAASIHAVKYAILLAKQFKCGLVCVYVVDTCAIKQLVERNIFIADEGKDYEENLRLGGRRYLNFVEELANAKHIKVDCVMRSGDVCDELIKCSVERNADIIILGGWDNENKNQSVMSHIHRNVLLRAHCSVLTAKGSTSDRLYSKA